MANVAGNLVTIAADGKLADASQIFDEEYKTGGEFQSAINKELKGDVGILKGSVEDIKGALGLGTGVGGGSGSLAERVGNVEKSIETVKSDVESAKNKADEAKTEAGKAMEYAKAVETDCNNLTEAVENLSDKVEENAVRIESATDAAENALNAANAASGKADTALSNASSALSQIANKVDTATYNAGLAGKVDKVNSGDATIQVGAENDLYIKRGATGESVGVLSALENVGPTQLYTESINKAGAVNYSSAEIKLKDVNTSISLKRENSGNSIPQFELRNEGGSINLIIKKGTGEDVYIRHNGVSDAIGIHAALSAIRGLYRGSRNTVSFVKPELHDALGDYSIFLAVDQMYRSANYSLVCGGYADITIDQNDSNNDTVFAIGNGAGNSSRRNAIEVKRDGRCYLGRDKNKVITAKNFVLSEDGKTLTIDLDL